MKDAHGLTSTASLTIAITGSNDAPVLNGTIADQVIAEDNALSFTVPGGTFSDADSASLTYTATLADGTSALPGWLHFDAVTMTFSGTPDLNWNGAIGVKVTASDGSLSVSDTFTLTVTPVNDAPIVTNDVYVTDEDTALSGLKPFINDSDIEGSPSRPTALPSEVSWAETSRSSRMVPCITSRWPMRADMRSCNTAFPMET